MTVFGKLFQKNLKLVNHNGDLNQIMENRSYDKLSPIEKKHYFRPCVWFIACVCMEFGQYLNHTPFQNFPSIKFGSYY
jgi:hypothetical protein